MSDSKDGIRGSPIQTASSGSSNSCLSTEGAQSRLTSNDAAAGSTCAAITTSFA
jgi:hypothetical protein